MAENPDYILELSGAAAQDALAGQPQPAAGPSPRKWIGVHFKCCDVYSRIWRNHDGTAYSGHCPRCSRKIQATIGPDGVSARFFTAS